MGGGLTQVSEGKCVLKTVLPYFRCSAWRTSHSWALILWYVNHSRVTLPQKGPGKIDKGVEVTVVYYLVERLPENIGEPEGCEVAQAEPQHTITLLNSSS